MPKNNAPSGHAKKHDQLYLAKSELDDKEKETLKKGVAAAEAVFGIVARTLFAGTKNWRRLCAQAGRHRKSPLVYTATVLTK